MTDRPTDEPTDQHTGDDFAAAGPPRGMGSGRWKLHVAVRALRRATQGAPWRSVWPHAMRGSLPQTLTDLGGEIWRDPKTAKHAIAQALESATPALSRAFMGAASSLTTPFTVGMGLSLARLDETGCTATLPDWWRNRDDSGGAHFGAVAALVEFAVRSYWWRHSDPAATEIALTRFEWRHAGAARGVLRAELAIDEAEREEALSQARRERLSEVTHRVRVFDKAGQLAALVEVGVQLRTIGLLGVGRSDGERVP